MKNQYKIKPWATPAITTLSIQRGTEQLQPDAVKPS